MQSSLPAGWLAFTGRVSNPLDRKERFQISFSSSFPGLFLTQQRSAPAPAWQETENHAPVWLRRACSRTGQRWARTGPMAGALWTSYDASFPAMGGRNEKAFQSRQQTSQGATPQGVEAEGPQCAQSHPPPQFIPYWPDRGRAARPRAERGAGAAGSDGRRAQTHQPVHLRSEDGAQHVGRIGGAALRADKGLIFQRDGDVLRLVANLGYSREAERYWLEHPLPSIVAARPGEPYWKAGQSIFPTCWPIPNTGRPAIRNWLQKCSQRAAPARSYDNRDLFARPR
jgi:hypothetical protein